MAMPAGRSAYLFTRNERHALIFLSLLCAWIVFQAQSLSGDAVALACPSYSLFNLPCPGCGLTRSLIALVRGEWTEAILQNPLVLLILPCFVFLWVKIVIGVLTGWTLPGLPPRIWRIYQGVFAGLWFLLLGVRTVSWFSPGLNPGGYLLPF